MDDAVARTQARAVRLQETSASARKDAISLERDLDTSQRTLGANIAALERELAFARDAARDAARRVGDVARQFRSTLKRPELQRLAARIDAWAPETRITRVALRRMAGARERRAHETH